MTLGRGSGEHDSRRGWEVELSGNTPSDHESSGKLGGKGERRPNVVRMVQVVGRASDGPTNEAPRRGHESARFCFSEAGAGRPTA